jgi:DNA-binding NtrC family response regulator
MINDKITILILDDDPIYRSLVENILSRKYPVLTAAKPSIAFSIMQKNNISILVSDFKMPEMDGVEVLERVKAQFPSTEVILISNEGDMQTVIDALRLGAADYLTKPFRSQDIWMSVERTIKLSGLNKSLLKAESHNQILKEEISKQNTDEIIGNSLPAIELKRQIGLVSETRDTSVLIVGESGTGKELVARAIHRLSSRNSEVFGAVNMSAIPESLFESEFFGHKKGSFTGAISDRAGWFESTDKGTLFLDEIGEMTMALQVKLLRVLEDRRFVKIGTQTEQKFDARIISATNKTPAELTDKKNFRTDLFHRLATYIIFVPALRERRGDIPELCEYFLEMMNKKTGRNVKAINKSVFDLFDTYSFPGNIRELKNMIERAVIVSGGKNLSAEHFITFDRTNEAVELFNSDVIWDLEELERKTILAALAKVNYNKSKAAKLLNLEWNALYRRIVKYGIDLPQ